MTYSLPPTPEQSISLPVATEREIEIYLIQLLSGYFALTAVFTMSVKAPGSLTAMSAIFPIHFDPGGVHQNINWL